MKARSNMDKYVKSYLIVEGELYVIICTPYSLDHLKAKLHDNNIKINEEETSEEFKDYAIDVW